jgi:hypothetical protein
VGEFALLQTDGIDSAAAGRILQDELTAALADNGLQVTPDRPTVTLEGEVQLFTLRPPFIRWLTGKCRADLVVSGTIRQGQETVFAFRDRVAFTALVTPRQPPLEAELLARRAVRQFADDLLNELLLPVSGLSPKLREVPPPANPGPDLGDAGPAQGVVADGG